MTETRLRQIEWVGIAALGLAWMGIWGAWIPHETAALTQNGVNLAEWSGFLVDVRHGALTHMPQVLRLAVALVVTALVVAAGAIRAVGLRWAVRIAAALPGLMLLPPYPQVLQLWRGDYGLRFVVALVVWGGVAATLLLDRLPDRVRYGLSAALAGGAIGTGLWAYLALRAPFEAHYAAPLAPGWGVIVFTVGLGVGLLVEGILLFLEDA